MKIIRSLLAIITCAGFAACDRPASSGPRKGEATLYPETRVFAASPEFPAAERATARIQFDLMASWLVSVAAPESKLLVYDALTCRPVATLKAPPGAPRKRAAAIAKPLAAARAFLNRQGPRQDGRIRLPQLAQALAQAHLPAGSTVVVLGNPLFIGEGSDEYFSMKAGRVPTDGFLFLDSRQSIYSVLGRETALRGQFWHLGYPDDSVFLDDSHRQGVARFWSVYLRSQGGTLASFSASLSAAAQSAREGKRSALLLDEPDKSARPVMLKVVKVVRDLTSQQQPVLTPENIAPSPLDRFGNPAGAEHDLVPDGALAGQRVLMVLFDPDSELSRTPLGEALETKGCNLQRVTYPLPKLAEWKASLESVNQVWLFSSKLPDRFPRTHAAALVDRWKTGKLALYVAGENDPYFIEANQLLALMAPGAEMAGNSPGGSDLSAADREGIGFDARSPLFHGIHRFFEGSTVAHVSGAGLDPVCRHTGKGTLIATIDRQGCGRVVLDCGYTRWLPRYWETAGAPRLAVNIAGWLTNGIPVSTGSH